MSINIRELLEQIADLNELAKKEQVIKHITEKRETTDPQLKTNSYSYDAFNSQRQITPKLPSQKEIKAFAEKVGIPLLISKSIRMGPSGKNEQIPEPEAEPKRKVLSYQH